MHSRPQFDRRSAGILMHFTSLPGPHGNGDLGDEAHRFIEFLAAAGQRWWQTLPGVTPSNPGFSPYSAQSAFAGSPWLVSLETLHQEGLLPAIKPFPKTTGSLANLDDSVKRREAALRQAFDSFNRRFREHGDFAEFCRRERSWLDDWGLFAALKRKYHFQPWQQWDRPIRARTGAAMKEARKDLAEEIDFHRFVQYEFDRQWQSLREAGTRSGVALIGDVPMFVAGDSCDVWANQQLFTLAADGHPASISGVPPDLFSDDGQIWNHPQYRWSAHRRSRFDWWVRRFDIELQRFDGVRIDHFLGFYRTWFIAAGAKTARRGEWVIAPGRQLLDAVHRAVGPAPIIAEDLGLLTPGAAKLRELFGFPGMRVMQFGFDDPYYLPHRYVEDAVVYSGTHDNNTTRGWFDELPPARRKKVLAYLGCDSAGMTAGMIRALMASVARTVILPIQDVLDLDAAARMNVPGSAEKNWRWRLRPGQLQAAVARRLHETTALHERLPDVAHPGVF